MKGNRGKCPQRPNQDSPAQHGGKVRQPGVAGKAFTYRLHGAAYHAQPVSDESQTITQGDDLFQSISDACLAPRQEAHFRTMENPLLKVLVVDADPALRQLLADYLNSKNYDTLQIGRAAGRERVCQ